MQIRLIFKRAAWAFSVVTLAACSLNAQPQITATETPPATATVTPTPTPTETPAPPTATPLPTIVPQVALDAASRNLVNGAFEDAVESYRLVLAQGNAAPVAAWTEAALGLAQAANRDGLFADAVAPLTDFIARFPDHENLSRAYFLRGDAYLGLGRWSDAVADFQQVLSLEPYLIDSTVYGRIGDAYLALGLQEEAVSAYTDAIAASRSYATQAALRERLARLLALRGEWTLALAQYDSILSVSSDQATRARIEMLMADNLLSQGESERAMNRMRRIVDTYPRQPQAYTALVALLDEGYDIETLQLARVALAHGDYDLTITVLNDYTTRYQLAAVPAELYMLLGRAYREIGNVNASVVAFQTVIEQYPRDPAFGDALLEQGHTRALLGDIPGAIQQYARIAANYGYLAQAAEALWQAGYLYATSGQLSEARAAFERLAEAYPNTFQARRGLSVAASTAMLSNDLAGAERLYGLLAVSASGEEQAAAYLNAGRLGQLRGDARFANDALNQAIAAAPDSYYAARALDLLAGREAFAPAVPLHFQTDAETERREAETWLREHFEGTYPGALWPLPPELSHDPRLVAGSELWRLGAITDARVEFADLMHSVQDDGIASYQLAIYFRELGAYSDSIIAAANVVRAAGAGTLDVPAAISRLRYPAYYLDIIETVVNDRGIDPLLVLALIRHESLFDPYASTPSGSKGLLQLRPGVATYLAEQTGAAMFQQSQLYRPETAITMGVHYLAEQLERFDGNVVAALAAFHAGPERAQEWLDLSGGDPDRLMTAITLDETRTFVQRLYSYHNVYRALYGEAVEQIVDR